MKNQQLIKTYFSLFFMFLLFSNSSFAQWEYKHASPTGNNLRKIAFADNTIGWMVGEAGTILKTTDAGNTWTNQYSFQNDDIIDLNVIDTGKIYYLANINQLYLSIDGGNSWSLKSSFFGANASAISFISLNEGWACVGNTIQHTIDGGNTWNNQQTVSGDNLTSIKIESNGNGIATTELGSVLHTADFGQSWSINSSFSGVFNAMDIVTFYATALVAFNNTLYKSTDNGVTWNAPINTPSSFSGSAPTSVKIVYANIYLATTEDGELFFTSDGGLTWNTNSTLLGNPLNNCIGLSPTKIIAVGDNGKIAISNNAGLSLTSLDNRVTNQELWGIHHTGSICYAVGDAGTIVKSTNNGQSWTNLNSGITANLKSITSFNNNTAVAVGNGGTILRTTNGGTAWSLVNTIYSDDINVINRLPNGIFYAVGNNDLILKSTNYGNTWNFETTAFTGFQYNFTDVYFATNDTGFIATNSAEILTTDDGGQNWYLRMTGLLAPMTCLNFSDGLNGWVGSNNGEILYTNDGGQTWTDRSMVGFTGYIHRLKFNDANIGWAFTDQGIFKTNDNGLNWEKEFSPCNNVHGVDFIDSYSALAVGSGQGKIIGRAVDIQTFVGSGAYCSGHEYSFGAFTFGNFNAGNTFIAQLSDDFGNFDYPTTMAVVPATIMNSITFTIPSGIPPSNLYRFRIASTNPPMYSNIPLATLDVTDSPQALIYANGNTTFNNGDSVILIDVSGTVGTYQWYRNGLLLPGATDDSLVVYSPGSYLININDGICDGNSNAIEVIVNGVSGISNLNNLNLKYYPNPTIDQLTIELSTEKFQQYTIVDVNGREILTSNGDFYNQMNIPVNPLSPGFYLLRLIGEKQSTLKFIKE
jgi:photosystem II stability/assembly factor-like uncharacterized protein